MRDEWQDQIESNTWVGEMGWGKKVIIIEAVT